MGELRGAYMASVRQRDGRWTGLYRDQGRQRSAGTYDTKTSALKAARAAEALAASGIDPRPAQTGMLYPSARRGRITVAGYAPGWLSGHRLEPPTCRSFIRQVEATGLSSSTTGLIMTVLRAMCETAVADRLMDRNPTSGIKIATRHAAPSALRSLDLTDTRGAGDPRRLRRVVAKRPPSVSVTQLNALCRNRFLNYLSLLTWDYITP